MKRASDLILTIPVFALTLPIQGLTALVIYSTMGKPILFRQVRPGLHADPFEMMKFRTMLHIDPERGLVDDVDRVTKVGAFLRTTSLDELPTLWNVIKGDMSIVGPRPLLFRYLPFMTDTELRRHEVRPGITGWAQVNGRNNLGWDERLRLDVAYVQNCSLRNDLACIVRTLAKVLRRSDVNVVPDESMLDLDMERSVRALG
jgi:lipopolysaccharide/colanic/teichoic acid biosynthesis glycosyltransferase